MKKPEITVHLSNQLRFVLILPFYYFILVQPPHRYFAPAPLLFFQNEGKFVLKTICFFLDMRLAVLNRLARLPTFHWYKKLPISSILSSLQTPSQKRDYSLGYRIHVQP